MADDGSPVRQRGRVTLQTPLRDVVGARTATPLAAKLDLATVGDLLRHYPRRYERRGRMTDLAELVVGEKVTVLGTVRSVQERRPRPGSKVRSMTTVVVSDGSARISCAFFNQPWLGRLLTPGVTALFSGTVGRFRSELQLQSAQVAVIDDALGEGSQRIESLESFPGGVVPIYPLADGVSLTLVQRAVKTVLDVLETVDDPVPDVLLATRGLTGLDTALRDVHRPPSEERLDVARARLRYDEALALQLVLAQRRAAARRYPAVPCPPRPGGVLAAFDAALPFPLTDGQRGVGAQIAEDLSGEHPMHRLLQGEVGSGKTVVALRAMLQAVDAGRQAVLLAPTEVLAAQHARSLRTLLGPLGRGGELDAAPEAVKVTLLTGSLTTRARRQALLDLVSGEAGIAVGTHALLSGGVLFAELGLVVIDEQHRFGVEQRDALRGRRPDGASPPHVLVMTATPIPRTVAMTVYGDLETSVLEGLPAGRSPISTTVVPAAEKPAWLDRAWQRVREEVEAGHQAYVVCPKIGDDEPAAPGRAARRATLQDDDEGADWADGEGDGDGGSDGGPEGRRPPLAVLDVAERLAAGPLAGLVLRPLHGRLPPADKDRTMRDFAAGEVQVLVSTTVIEVGVDVPNATIMVVLDADRFGMSQLHQLRGRVGRGSAPGVCLLVTEAPPQTPALQRLAAVAATTDGFELAEADLQLRREGDVLGTSQAGRASGLKQLSLLRDRDVIAQARADATELIGDDPDLAGRPALAALAASVIRAPDQEFLEKS
ncbi:ATP-dependent DNA helicase RecG [Nakamurella endophytica]|uniref:ATP-dependent DNA helicase RecG n=1 Tax=Nakamurella endophytica TaxID=1748367 RepID=UPI001E3993F5|nr:ATP-dependent DNA helicase RecG [Nakamurella endophytica]